MTWLEVNREIERPSESVTESLWRSVEIRVVRETPSAVADYLSELRRVNVNGGAVFAQFEVSGSHDFDWFATRNRWHEMSFFSGFLTHWAVQKALPEVIKKPSFDEPVTFEWGSSLTLDGELAKTLVIGGAYEKFKGSPRAAKQLGARACDALFGDRYLEVEIFRCGNAWSDWFYDVAWDFTCVVIDRRFQRVSLLASTDTD